METLRKIGKLIGYLNFKTIYLNIKYLPLGKAIYLPILASKKVKLRKVKGKVIITCPVRTGLIKLGADEVGHFDKRHNRTVWENYGTIIFNGTALVKYGAKIIVGSMGRLELGNNFRFSSGSVIICYKSVIIGDNCRVAWETQIIDSDFHRIFDEGGSQINPDKDIIIRKNCWIGNRCTISKGAILGNDTVVASNSLVNKKFTETNVIIGGIPGKIIKTGITWGD